MSDDSMLARATDHLLALTQHPDRHVGAVGNRAATEYFASAAASLGWDVARTPFACIDWEHGEGVLTGGSERFAVNVTPYSQPCDVTAPLVAVESIDALEALDAPGCILLLHGEIASGQLMPRDYPFYYPEEHRRIYEALDALAPAAVLSATGKDPGMAGGEYPFPLIEDGAFEIPSGYLKDVDALALLAFSGQTVRLRLDSRRVPAEAEHVVATLSGSGAGRVLALAHIDSKLGSPGAIDNATGAVVLLLAAELLAEREGGPTVELWPINGEDHYAAFGERFWLATYSGRTDEITLGINIDGVGYAGSPPAVSMYGCGPETTAAVTELVDAGDALVAGDPWYQGDHAVLMQSGVPAIAVTSADMPAIWTTIAHTERDVPAIVDAKSVVETARFVVEMVERS
ncbi:MAG: M28 family peptidase [Coriobacteriia bacterium]